MFPNQISNKCYKIKDETKKELPVIIKADVHGSSEAIKDGVLNMGNEEIACGGTFRRQGNF